VERVEKDSTLHDVGLKVSAKVVRGTIVRNTTTQQVDFRISDGKNTFPVVYVGLVPDTFTDDTEIDVVVEGKFGRDQVFHATDVIAKCGSRYEAVLKEPTKKA
jgi:cytochrome c-type biogenesis protein CcmE